jgi:hypothetical protein
MMTPTHLAFAVAGTSLLLGTANPLALICNALSVRIALGKLQKKDSRRVILLVINPERDRT